MKENRRKGFTLIELLAVIIVLALILVFAIPAVLNTSEKAQKKSFATYGRRVLTLAEEYIEAKKLDGAVGQMAIQNGVDGFLLGRFNKAAGVHHDHLRPGGIAGNGIAGGRQLGQQLFAVYLIFGAA